MIIQELHLENFLIMSKADVNLDNKGLILIVGENKDDTSANSNGSGKSTIVDALCWCLYGTTARGISGDDVVNRTNKENCFVSVKIQDGENLYEITRYRKHNTYKNNVKVIVNGSDLTKPSTNETDKLIVSLLGITEEIFKVTVYCGQEAIPYLPAMTDKQIKELIENAAGLTELQKAYEVVKVNKLNHSGAVLTLKDKVQTLKQEIFDLEGKKKVANANVNNWEKNRQTEIQLREEEQHSAVTEFQQLVAKFKQQYGDEIEARIKEINNELGQTQSLRDDYEQKSVLTTSALYACDTLANVINSKNLDIQRIQQEINAIKTGDKGKCPTCGRDFSEADIADSLKSLYEQIQNIKNDIINDESDLRVLHRQYEDKKKERDEAKSRLPDITALTSELQVLNDKMSEKTRRYLQLTENKNFLQQQQVKIDDLKVVENPHISSLQSIESMLTAKEKELEQLNKDSEDIYKQMTIDENLINIFSPAGVRAHILDVVTPFLNSKTNKYLSTLSCGNLTAEWNTLNTTKTGAVKEKFQINVTNKTGANNYKGLSGGEKRKVNLACVLALQDLAAIRAKKSFELWVGDEIDNALDGVGLELLMAVLNEKAQEKGTVLIISHNDLKEWISQSWVIVKENGVSVIK